MSGPVQPPLTVETIDGATVGRPITKIKVTNGTLAVSGSTATLTISGGGGGSGTVTSIATTAPLTGGTITTTGTIGIPVATGAADGYLSSANFNTFDAKQDAITLTTTGTSGAATFAGGTLNIPQYSGTTGTVTGTGVANQVSYWTAASVQAGSTGLTYDPSTGDLTVGGYVEVGTKITTPTGTDLTLDTVGGTDSGSIIIADGVNGQLSISANGTGAIKLGAANNPVTVSNVYTLPTVVTTDNNYVLTAQTDGSTAWAASGGGGGVTFPLEADSGSLSNPSYSFSGDTNTGMYSSTADNVNLVTGGSIRATFNSSGISIGDNTNVGKLSSLGANNLQLETNNGTNSGSIVIEDGVNGNIDIIPDGTGKVKLGTLPFKADQTVGVGQDNYVLTYDNASDSISLEAAGGGGSSNDFSKILPQIGSMSAANQYNISTSPPWGGGQIVTQAISSMALGARPYAFPFIAPQTGTVSAVGVVITTAESGVDLYVGIYENDSNNLPSTLVGYATIDMSSTGTIYSTSLTGTISLTAGEQFWYSINTSANVFNGILDAVSTSTGIFSATPLGLTDDINDLNYSIKDTTVSANAVPPSTYSTDDLDGSANRVVVGLKF